MGRLDVQLSSREPGTEPWWELQLMGPCIAVRVELHPSEIQQARLEGRSTPQPVMASALIDTGASITVIDQSIQVALDPAVVGVTFLKGIRDDQALPRPRVAVRLSLGGSLGPWDAMPACDMVRGKSNNQTILLGRDFLKGGKLIYDGAAGLFSIIDSD